MFFGWLQRAFPFYYGLATLATKTAKIILKIELILDCCVQYLYIGLNHWLIQSLLPILAVHGCILHG